MKVFVWADVSRCSYSYHSGGGVVVFAETEQRAREYRQRHTRLRNPEAKRQKKCAMLLEVGTGLHHAERRRPLGTPPRPYTRGRECPGVISGPSHSRVQGFVGMTSSPTPICR